MTDTALIKYESEITAEALAKIQENAENYLETITTEPEYKLIYDEYQEIRRLRIAVNKRADELIKSEKINFESAKKVIESGKDKILDILTPIETKLLETRKAWEDQKEAVKRAEAEAEAKRQREEQQRIQQEQASIRREKEELEAKLAKAEAEKQELLHQITIEATRLSFDEAWEDWQRIDTEHKKAAKEIEEKRNHRIFGIEQGDDLVPVKPKVSNQWLKGKIETERTRLSFDEAYDEAHQGIYHQQIGKAIRFENQKEKAVILDFGADKPEIINNLPIEQENATVDGHLDDSDEALFQEDQPMIQKIRAMCLTLHSDIDNILIEGLDSQRATSAVYHLKETIKITIEKFETEIQ